MSPEEYLTAVIARISASPAIVASQTLREYVNPYQGYLRMRLTFADDAYLEFHEYIERGENGEILLLSYSYHWADRNGRLIRRWDNAKHFPNLENFPHHVHLTEEEVVSGKPLNIFDALEEIENVIARR